MHFLIHSWFPQGPKANDTISDHRNLHNFCDGPRGNFRHKETQSINQSINQSLNQAINQSTKANQINDIPLLYCNTKSTSFHFNISHNKLEKKHVNSHTSLTFHTNTHLDSPQKNNINNNHNPQPPTKPITKQVQLQKYLF